MMGARETYAAGVALGAPHNSTCGQSARQRLAVVLSHPIQYYSPWFAHIARTATPLELKVFYLWDAGVTARHDPGFGQSLQWDVPLLDGYEYEFVPNRSPNPGTDRFSGLANPDLVDRVHVWSPDAVLVFGYAYRSHVQLLLARRLRAIPMIMRGDSHDLSVATGVRPRFMRLVRAALFRRFSAFLAVGSANAAYLQNAGVHSSRIFFAPHCVDNDRFRDADVAENALRWKQELGMPRDRQTILFAGKFEAKKRPLDLLEGFIRAAAVLREEGQAAPTLLFVGAGPLEAELRAQAGKLIGRDVFFAPFQNQSQMPRVYAACDLFILPSFGRSETWGLAVNEAMNMGRPVIVSSHVGCGPDLVMEGETGRIFEAGNVDALALALVETLRDHEALREMGMRAREHVSRYSFDAVTSGLLSAVRAVVRPRS